VQEFCDRADLPYCFYTAVKGASAVEAVTMLHESLAESTLLTSTTRALLPSAAPSGWGDMFRLLAALLPDTPSIVVLDELPWLSEQDATFDGQLQVAWDRLLSRKPVLLLLLGSDLHMMQRFTDYSRPFYGRADPMTLGPFNPAETATVTGLTGADAIDAHLITAGLPGLVLPWPTGTPALDYLSAEIADPTSALYGIPEQSLAAEFPTPDTARRIIEAVGGAVGRTYANIAATASDRSTPLSSGTLGPLLHRLTDDKQTLAVDRPVSTKTSKLAQYRVADSSLSLYLAILRDAHHQVQRGRNTAAQTLLTNRWSTWRGTVEPLIRDALTNAAIDGDLPWNDAQHVGGWWNRQSNPEIDLVGADRGPVAKQILFAGSIKWQDGPFDRHHLTALRRDAEAIPGFDPSGTGLVIVSRSGTDLADEPVDLTWGPGEVLAAWTA
jgi:uncharacterized protein